MSNSEKLATAVGRRAKQMRLAGGLTLEDVAKRASSLGLKWTTARVVEFENGKKPLALATLIIVCQALAAENGPARLADLVPESGDLEVTPDLVIPAGYIRSAFAGEQVFLPTSDVRSGMEKWFLDTVSGLQGRAANWEYVRGNQGLVDQRAAKRLGMTLDAFAQECFLLWGQTLEAERDSRRSELSNAQTAGRVTRDLLQELSDIQERRRLLKARTNGND
ncbi:helix-turn-helix domain-containing protein [Arthrobacter sp. Hz1]